MHPTIKKGVDATCLPVEPQEWILAYGFFVALIPPDARFLYGF
jgi:hypothetical protein